MIEKTSHKSSNSGFHHFEIGVAQTGRNCSIKCDGVEMKGVTKFTVTADVRKVSVIKIEMLATADIKGECKLAGECQLLACRPKALAMLEGEQIK